MFGSSVLKWTSHTPYPKGTPRPGSKRYIGTVGKAMLDAEAMKRDRQRVKTARAIASVRRAKKGLAA